MTGNIVVNEDFMKEIKILQKLNSDSEYQSTKYVPELADVWQDSHFWYYAMHYQNSMSFVCISAYFVCVCVCVSECSFREYF